MMHETETATEAKAEEVEASAAETAGSEEELCAQAAQQNAQNERCAAGNGGGMPGEYLTPAQVRAMDRREVRENYALIIESMKHWQ